MLLTLHVLENLDHLKFLTLNATETPVSNHATQFFHAAAAHTKLDTRCSLLLSGLLSSLDASTIVMLDSTESSGFVVWVDLLEIGGDLDGFDGLLGSSAWENLSRWLSLGGCGLELVSSGVVDLSLLRLAFNTRPEDELILVSVQSLDIKLKGVIVTVGSSVIDADSDSSSEASAKSSSLELKKRETTAVSNFACIPASLRSNDGSQLLNGSWEHLSGLVLSASVSTELGSWLVVMSVVLLSGPVLAKMYVWDDVVVLDHC